MLAKNFLIKGKLTSYIQSRCMARGRNYYLKGASRNTGISPESRDLLLNVRHAENVDEWKHEHGIGEPIKFTQYRENVEDVDDEKDLDMTYFPHKGETWPEDYEPSPVLIVTRVKDIKGQPWWHKMDLERIGLGIYAKTNNTRVALPNLSFYNALLYRVKHLVEIIPVEFPNGIPDQENFDVKRAKVTEDGNFLYHEKIAESNNVLSGEGPIPADKLKVTVRTIESEAFKSWQKPWNSPHGNSNYHRDLRYRNPQAKDYITDDSNKISY